MALIDLCCLSFVSPYIANEPCIAVDNFQLDDLMHEPRFLRRRWRGRGHLSGLFEGEARIVQHFFQCVTFMKTFQSEASAID